MKDVFIGIIIIIVIVIVGDFIYTERSTCTIQSCAGCPYEEVKCGLLKKQLNVDIELFGRYW